MKWTKDHEKVFQEIIKVLKPPKFVIPNLKAKYKRIKWTNKKMYDELQFFKGILNDR